MKILVLVYSRSGNCLTLAEAARDGAASVSGTTVTLKRVPELQPEDTLASHPWTGAIFRERIRAIPCATLDDLVEADGFIIGSGTRFGSMASEMKHFLEEAGALWMQNTLLGRPAGVLSVASTPHGGQEQSALGLIVTLMHFGMLIVPPGYGDPLLHQAGSPYGAVAVAGGRAGKKLQENDLAVATYLGRRVADVTVQLARGKQSADALVTPDHRDI